MMYPSTSHRSIGLAPAARLALAVTAVLWAAAAAAQTNPPPGTTPAPAGPTNAQEGEVVKLSPFEVSTVRDYGYRASNSIAGTRTDTPIKDVPINIQVFTKEFTDDLVINNQVDMEAYNGALVYGGADSFSNWGLRDGIREYDPLDAQGLARVEVVKGPAAALYGLAYPGGVMNNISKSVDYARNFVIARLTWGSENDRRATIDANVTGKVAGGRFGVRYNGAYEETADVRAHSDGRVKFQQIQLNWQPAENTTIEFLAETGYRAIPNGINNNDGYTTFGAPTGEAGNHSDIPLQILRPDISWDWNFSNGRDFRSLEINLRRLTVTQKVADNFQVQAYYQYSDRLNIDGNGWDASGSGGADSWESAGSGFSLANNTVTSTYHYRDWGNKMHSYGVTAVYKLDFSGMKNTFAFGGAAWAEKELARAAAPVDPAASAVVYPIQADIPTLVPNFVPADLTQTVTGTNNYHHENNSNDYYFANWQASFVDNRLKTNVGINKTNMKLLGWNGGDSPVPDTVYNASKISPLFGAVFDITKEVSVFAVHSTSLFPDTTKDSFGHTFSPQVGSSIEGGFKVEMMDGKLSGTVSYYDIKQTGGTQSAPNHQNLNTQTWDTLSDAQRALKWPGQTRATLFAAGDIITGGEQQAKGFDLDVAYTPISNWQFVASFSHVNHEFVTSSLANTIGETYPYAIRDRYSLLTRYQFTQGDVKGLSIGSGISGGSKQLIDYQSWNGVDVARYNPARMWAEVFAAYRFKLVGQNALVQLNIKNLTKTPSYAGWRSTGSASILATERYKVPTPIIWRLTVGFDF
jgi:iron complex outermembrane recepter protein